MSDSLNLGLPYMEAAQAQKHVTHNEALAILDALTHIAVASMGALEPPPAAANGARVVVAPAATGAFAGHAGQIAFLDEGAWRFASPKDGWLVWSTADACAFMFAGGQWARLDDSIRRLQNLSELGVATTADAANPLSVRGPNALFTARAVADGGSGDLRLKLNKEAAANTVSQLYQTNWSGRAETGLVGNDTWTVRRSADGAAWTTSLVVDLNQVAAPFGSLAAPGLAFVGDEDTGVRRTAANALALTAGGVDRITISAAGVVAIPASAVIGDNSGTTGKLTVGAGVSQGLYFSVRGSIGAFGDGVFMLRDNAGSSFGRLQFGGSTSAYPSLKRSAALLQSRLADDSGYAGLECAWVRPASFTVATVPAAATAGAGATIYVSNESSGATPAFSDGAAWRRVADRAVIS